jgi:hypothetical protein
MTVRQQQGRSLTAYPEPYLSFAGVDTAILEPCEHGG